MSDLPDYSQFCFDNLLHNLMKNAFQYDASLGMPDEANIVKKSSQKSEEIRNDGNKIFVSKHSKDKKSHIKILAHYSKSIALAPTGSEELAAAYSNRSALLKHLNFQAKALIDIDRALEITKSDSLKIKLLARKTECLRLKDAISKLEKDSNLMSNHGIESRKQFQLDATITKRLTFSSFKPSQQIPCAAESVTIAYNKSLGRHIIATRNIKPGEIVIFEEAYAVFPNINTLYLICSYCLTLAWNGIPCDHCATALYCSEECKTKAWEEYHDVECSILPYLLKNGLSAMMLDVAMTVFMTARVFIRAVKSEGLEKVLMDSRMIDSEDMPVQGLISNGIYDNRKFKFCYNLLTDNHQHRKLDYVRQEYCPNLLMYLLLRHSTLLDKYKIIKDGDLARVQALEIKTILTKIMNILPVNEHSVQTGLPCDCSTANYCNDTCIEKKGVYFASCASLMNHSCAANISRVFTSERKMAFFTVCPVRKGEQLCDNYGIMFQKASKLERQLFLWCHSNFTCQCQACQENWSQNLKSSVLRDFEKLNSNWFRNRYLKYHDLPYWPYNEETMNDVIKASELAHKNFDQNNAYLLSIPCLSYIQETFHSYYDDDNHVPEKC